MYAQHPGVAKTARHQVHHARAPGTQPAMFLRLTLLLLLTLGVAAHQHGDPISLLRRTQHRGVST